MKQVHKDVQFLLDYPKISLGAQYHDAGSCWTLIEAMRIRLTRAERVIEAARPAARRRSLYPLNMALFNYDKQKPR